MQTFLPYRSYTRSAQCLDRLRLGKQRVETLQILNNLLIKTTGWAKHPAVRMWKGYERSLTQYGLCVCLVWIGRGYKDTCFDKISKLAEIVQSQTLRKPQWLTPEFCRRHQSNLVRKNPDHYREFFPDVPDDLDYIWPVQ